ncbi:MAG: hypothetical protein HQL37_13665, partial [Alphaproteobacteria bacterium]|nr:hypothetical protein [Alphaproteobacteria bacterium]
MFFNSSFHHCDDPEKALHLAKNSLKPNGQIFLVNENFLRPWVTKAKYASLLETDPAGVGHYGGNEHAYHNWEYAAMLKRAGFTDVRMLTPNTQTALEKIEYKLLQIHSATNRRVYNKASSILIRLIYY